jgi:hypothetical protein
VLEQEERVADKVLLARFYDALLDGEAFGVGNAAELEEVDVHRYVLLSVFHQKQSKFELREQT